MDLPLNFISASEGLCTFENHVAAPYLRKSFYIDSDIDNEIAHADLTICGLGFYVLYVNGVNITKGPLAPYISSPNDIIYYDRYDVRKYLKQGENVIGIILGNGMQNPLGGYIWDFDKARWRGAPKLALSLKMVTTNGKESSLFADESFKTAPSPIIFDDLRCGEYYDARNEVPGWNDAGFDDSSWLNAVKAPTPAGEARLCEADSIVVTHELKPVSIIKQDDGYLYDFGVNAAGVCKLVVDGSVGQEISLEHGERLVDAKLHLKNIQFVPDGYVQRDIYICKGEQNEIFIPQFTYHGFQYVFVKGITEEQATEGLLTYLVMNSDLKECGGFECSNEVANKLQELTRRSTLANFYYFPTDCPHREKNGWTGDAAVSAEHTLLNLTPEKSYMEWLRNVRKAQNENGALPGIVPTGGWGFHWGNGPAWDSALTYLPYYTYIYRNDIEILKENATAIFRQLNYFANRIGDDGLIKIGLGDWCQPNRGAGDYNTPLEFTDSVITMDISHKAAFIFDVLGYELQKQFAEGLYTKLRRSIRERLIDFNTMSAMGNTQTAQAMAIFYNVFEDAEKPMAFERLLDLIRAADNHMDTGILGARVIFHVLSAFGHSDLAYDMITKDTFPSYGNWVKRGATSLWESFWPEGGPVDSMNHHFFGDISGWFIKWLTGINLNPYRNNISEVHITPKFIKALNYAEGFHTCPLGKIEVKWNRLEDSDNVELSVVIPEGMTGRIILDNDYVFDNGSSQKDLNTGTYRCAFRRA